MSPPDKLVNDILAAIEGDSDAWERLFANYRPALEKWANSFSTSAEMSRTDLVQDAWLQIWKVRSKFCGSDDPNSIPPVFYQWLRVTANNAMRTRIRGNNTKKRSPDNNVVDYEKAVVADPRTRTPSSIVSGNEQVLRLRMAILELTDPVDRQVIEMVTEDNFSLRVAAQLLGRDYSSIRRRFHKLLGHLGRVVNPP